MTVKTLEEFLDLYLNKGYPYMDLYFANKETYKELHQYAEKDENDPKNQVLLGYLYKFGESGEKNLDKSYQYFYKAAENGNPYGMFNVALANEQGNMVPKNLELAVFWYKKAVDADNTESMNNLGFLYEKGIGVEKDDRAAFELYKKAAMLGDSLGLSNYALAYKVGRGVDVDLEKLFFLDNFFAGSHNLHLLLACAKKLNFGKLVNGRKPENAQELVRSAIEHRTSGRVKTSAAFDKTLINKGVHRVV